MYEQTQRPNPIFGFLFLGGFIAFIGLLLIVLYPQKQPTTVAKLRSTNTFNVGLLSQRTNQGLANKPASVALIEALSYQYGWEAKYFVYDSFNQLIRALEQKEVDTIADMVIDNRVTYKVSFSTPYDSGTPVLVYFPKITDKVESLDRVPSNTMLIINDSWQERYLQRAKLVYDQLSWQELPEYFGLQGVIESISTPPGGYALVLEREYRSLSYITTSLQQATRFESVDLGFAFRAGDRPIAILVSAFIQNWLKENARNNLANKPSLQPRINRTDLKVFLGMIKERLPEHIEIFLEAGEALNLDWRLIAAIAYQESLWNEKAVSPTGVRGLMMLTKSTAASLGVKDRIDPRESVFGGTQYFLFLRNQIPKRIAEPDLSWFALAAYNVGLAHVEEVRKYTQQQGKNPDSWADVSSFMHLLEDPEWYSSSRYGYARGIEAKNYVSNVHKYFEVLLHLQQLSSKALPQDKVGVKQDSTIEMGSKLPTLTLPDRIVQRF